MPLRLHISIWEFCGTGSKCFKPHLSRIIQNVQKQNIKEALIQSARMGGERFLPRRGLENAGILYVLLAFQAQKSAEKVRCPQ